MTSLCPRPQARAVVPGSRPSTRSHTLLLRFKVRKKQRLGWAGTWVRVTQAGLGVCDEGDSAPFL